MKTYLMMNLTMNLAQGKLLFGDEDNGFPVEKRKVLYLALDDPPRRFQMRMHQVDPDLDPKELNNLTHKFTWVKLNKSGMDDLKKWLEEPSEFKKLVIIDIFGP